MRGGTLVTVIVHGVHALIASLITASPHGDCARSARSDWLLGHGFHRPLDCPSHHPINSECPWLPNMAGARSRLPWPRRRRERRALPLRRADLLRSGDLDLARWHLAHVPRAHPVALGVGMRHAAAALPAAAAALGAAALTAPLGAAVAPLNATLPAADQYDQYDARA